MHRPPLGFEPAGTGAVTHALAGFRQILLVVHEDGDKEASGRVGVPDRQRDAHAAGNPDVRDDLQAAGVEVVGQIHEEAVGFSGDDRPRVHALPRMSLGDLYEVNEHARSLVAQAIPIDVGAVERGHEGQVTANDAQRLRQAIRAPLRREHAEVVDDAAVGSLGEADGEDHRLARQADDVVGADDDEGFRGSAVKERGQAGLVAAQRLKSLADALGMPLGERHDRQGAFG